MNIEKDIRQSIESVIGNIASQTNTTKTQVNDVVNMALPQILGGLGKNASKSSGTQVLSDTLSKHHDGSLLDDIVSGIFGGDSTQGNSDGFAILGHIFGGKQSGVEQSVAKKTGLSAPVVAMILSYITPIVMAHLGRQKAKDNNGVDDLQSILQTFGGQKSGGLMGALSSIFGLFRSK